MREESGWGLQSNTASSNVDRLCQIGRSENDPGRSPFDSRPEAAPSSAWFG